MAMNYLESYLPLIQFSNSDKLRSAMMSCTTEQADLLQSFLMQRDAPNGPDGNPLSKNQQKQAFWTFPYLSCLNRIAILAERYTPGVIRGLFDSKTTPDPQKIKLSLTAIDEQRTAVIRVALSLNDSQYNRVSAVEGALEKLTTALEIAHIDLPENKKGRADDINKLIDVIVPKIPNTSNSSSSIDQFPIVGIVLLSIVVADEDEIKKNWPKKDLDRLKRLSAGIISGLRCKKTLSNISDTKKIYYCEAID
jgi:hypothetical protein